MPGVKAVQVVANVGKEFYYAGEEVLGLAADTEEHALDALRAVKVKYDPLPHIVREEDGLNANVKTVGGGGETNKIRSNQDSKGDVAAEFGKADAIAEGTYGVPIIAHQCLESHGFVCEFDKEGALTIWATTQAVTAMPPQFAGALRIPPAKVRCITHYMGGGFGSKFQPGAEGILCAQLARKAGKPVKLMLDREEEVVTAGTRPSAFGTVKIGGTKEGKITAFEAHCWGTAGLGAAAGVRFNELPYVYDDAVPAVNKDNHVVRTNTVPIRAWRAPGHPQSCIMTEWPIDDLAAKLGIDPMQLRLKNLPPSRGGPNTWQNVREKLYTEEIQIAARLSEWEKKWHPPGKGPSQGTWKHGIGMALHTWGGAGRGPNDVKVTISSSGSVQVQCSTQDLGTGERTVLAIVTAEVLGLDPHEIDVQIGESAFGRSTGSGGSTTCPGTAPAALNAATAARDALFDKLAPRLNAKKEDLAIEAGKIVDTANKKDYPWKAACAKLGMDTVVGTGDWTPGLSGGGVCGVQIAEVMVDTETGVVKCTKVVAVQDCGLVINKQGCESQVAGGVIMGLNPALWEERIMDAGTGRQLNGDMEFYKLGGIQDMPEIVVHMMDMPERGVIGIGEPPTISTTAAIGNAVFNALGVRVGIAPFTPDKVLQAIAKGGKS
jgi:xanthine dehydrogenase YagR molybdenum-binding subunit